ncbi:DUF192 domain-containing protein [Castellaniella denitrificans]|uniref:DUF192 domain-containing protein n=1 Tax=Castellaniella denitrificans TaxID=56119 RepID=A0ABT4M6K5_9BURK|nr:DUF192 domain-containing protein [Castellaniella denitrificans]MCZ4330955.1 DUF192 domain-containing protein [Castellaniella denitrificans]
MACHGVRRHEVRRTKPYRWLAWRGPRETAVWLDAQEPLRLYCARSFAARLLGLCLWPGWGARPRGLLLPECRIVHTTGLARAVDLVFLDAGGRVVGLATRVGPWRWVGSRRARAVVELPGGYCVRTDWRDQVEAAWLARKIVV